MLSCGVSHDCAQIMLRLLAIGLSNGAVLALNAIGVTLVYGAVRTINFAHGDVFALLSVLAAVLLSAIAPQGAAWPVQVIGALAALAATAAAGAGLSAAVERLAFRPFRSSSPAARVAPLIATIGLSFVLYQAALGLRFLTNAYTRGEHESVPGIPELPRVRVPDLLPRTDLAELVGLGERLTLPLRDLLMPLAALLVAALVGWFLERTRSGRALRAAAQDPGAAQLCGVDPVAAVRLAFALGGVLAGAAATIFALYYTTPYTLYGAQSGLLAFTAAVLGGIGRPRGALLAGLTLGVAAAFSDYFLAAQWTPVLLLALLMLLLMLRPSGLAAGAEREEASQVEQAADEAPRRQGVPQGRAALALLAVGLLYPLADSALQLGLLTQVTGMLIFALLALGLTLLLGYAGLLDLGYAAAFGIGSYSAGLLLSATGRVEFLLPLAVGAGAAALFGALNALVTFRLRGEYLAIVTLAFGQMAPQIALNLHRATGGSAGIAALPPPVLLGHALAAPIERYYLALALVALLGGALLRLRPSRIGRAWAAIAADETAAAFSGISVWRARMLAFVLGAGAAGAAGALFASVFSYVDPTQSELRVSAMVLAMVIIGGAGGVPGAVLGALAVASFDQLAVPLLGAWVQRASEGGPWWLAALDPRGYNYMAFGMALYLAVLLRMRASAASPAPRPRR